MKRIFILAVFLSLFQIPGNLYIHLILATLLFLLILINAVGKRISLETYKNSTSYFLLIWLIWSLISNFWSLDIFGWATYTSIIFIAFVYNLLIVRFIKEDKNFFEKILKLFLASNIIHNIIGWLEYFTGIYLFNFSSEMTQQAANYRNPLSFFTNTNDFAFYLLLSVVIIIFYARLNDFLKFFLLLSNILLIFQTDSRTMIISLIIVGMFVWIFSIKNRILRWIVSLLTFLSIVVGMFVSLMGNFLSILNDLNSSDTIRVNLIKNGLYFLSNNLFIGIGSGNGTYYLSNFSKFPIYNIDSFHNIWIEILVQYGLIFFIIFVIAYLYTLSKSYLLALNKNNNMNSLISTWLFVFIIASISSSTIFPRIWVWISMFLFINYVLFYNGKIKQYTKI